VSHPINTAQDFVISPLRAIPGQPGLRAALGHYAAAGATQQSAWTTAYEKGLGKAKTSGEAVVLPAGNYGPVSMMMASLLSLAQSGGLDGALLTSQQFYQTDYTKPLLFLADGSALADRAQAEHLLGEQWGMMNETGSWPGQVWLWLYTLWYQVKPFSTSDNADILVMTVMGLLSLLFVLIPFLPTRDGRRALRRAEPPQPASSASRQGARWRASSLPTGVHSGSSETRESRPRPPVRRAASHSGRAPVSSIP
jgi:hypothetical protein